MTTHVYIQCCCYCSPLKEDGTEDENAHSDVTDTNKSMHSTFLTALPGTCSSYQNVIYARIKQAMILIDHYKIAVVPVRRALMYLAL